MNDFHYIKQTFELAKRGLGRTWPNPLVGSVIVKNNRVIGQGHHVQYGDAHAEINALNNCTESPEGSTLYVNLEPCCHTEKQTPPCAQRLIKEKIKKVVICNLDPNPKVNGQGVAILRQHGIEVEHGILEAEGEKLNEVFFFNQRSNSSFVHLKLASTLDGKIALPNGESKWITGEVARQHVHYLRSIHQGVIVGAETLRKDNPQLNVRLENFQGEQPWRIVFTQSGKLPKESQIFHDEISHKTLVFSHAPVDLKLPPENIMQIKDLSEAFGLLKERKLINLFIEGGATLASQFIQEKRVQRVSYFINPSFLGSGKSALGDLNITQLQLRPKLFNLESQWFGGDLMLSGRVQ
jgi:diaminohydroxyphosphoribosylaminopyrimidine deaminase/5-amino-6-(5-phosphoribosylamino)uracil reductase